MKQDLRFLLAEPFGGLRKDTLNELEKVVKDFSVSFSLFLRENYSTQERWENIQLESNIWRCYKTDEEFTTEQIYSKFLEDYDRTSV